MPSFYTILKQKHWDQTPSTKHLTEIILPISDTLKMIGGLWSFLVQNLAINSQTVPQSYTAPTLFNQALSSLDEINNPTNSQNTKSPRPYQDISAPNKKIDSLPLSHLFYKHLPSPLLKEEKHPPYKLNIQNPPSNPSTLLSLNHPKKLLDHLMAKVLSSQNNGQKLIPIIEKQEYLYLLAQIQSLKQKINAHKQDLENSQEDSQSKIGNTLSIPYFVYKK